MAHLITRNGQARKPGAAPYVCHYSAEQLHRYSHCIAGDLAPPAGHLGKPGERLDVKLRVLRSVYIGPESAPLAWGGTRLTERWLVLLQTDKGHRLSWWTEHPSEPGHNFAPARVTVKKHESFKGQAQTVVQRVTFQHG
jgi:hypothetical protein